MEDFYDWTFDTLLEHALKQEQGTTDSIGTKYFLSFLIE